jgi:hypothetical protein
MTTASGGPDRAQLAQMLKTARARRGESLARANARHKDWRAVRKAITAHLASGESTVPALAAAVAISPAETLWHISGMRKYGLVEEIGMAGDYPTYGLCADESVSEGG